MDTAPWADPEKSPLVDVRNVTKNYGEVRAIDQISIQIYEGEFFAILGPSGCGKTTLMRMLAGFEIPTSGQITLSGQDLADTPPNKRPVNMMFQSYALFPHLSVAQNIAFGLKRDKWDKDQIAARVDEMLDLVQLSRFAQRKPHQLSGGQAQRVALARALAKKPKLLLLDEPMAALDKKLRQETQFELMDIQEALGTTFVIVTHDQEEAMTVSSRIAVMKDGALAQVDEPANIYESPNSRYVADFIGDVNIISGTIEAQNGDIAQLNWAEGERSISAQSEHTIEKSSPAYLAIRPEKIAINKAKPSDIDNLVKGKVLDIAYLGNISTYHVELANGDVIKAQDSNRTRLARRPITWEDDVWLSWTQSAGVLLRD